MSPITTLQLGGTWTLEKVGTGERYPAPVPGSVHDALLEAGAAADAHYGYNEREQLWVGDATWCYRRSFKVEATATRHEHVELVFEGLDTFAEVRLNGTCLGRADNMFRRWTFAAKDALLAGENTLEVILYPASEVMSEATARRHLPAWNEAEVTVGVDPWGPTGRGYVRKQACQFGWDWGPQCPSAGIWLPVRLEAWSGPRIGDWRCRQIHHDNGQVELGVELHPTNGDDVRVDAQLRLNGERVCETSEACFGGWEWRPVLTQPQLWWPNGMGAQPLYALTLVLRTADGVEIERIEKRIGLRRVELVREPDAWGRSFRFTVNGRTFFTKGSNWIPLDAHPSAREVEARYRRDLGSAVDAHMNLMRVWGGGFFAHQVFYDICDELGLLVWQDMAFGCGAYPTWDAHLRENVWQECVDQARRLRHHACLACWCGNNELEQGFTAPGWKANTRVADGPQKTGKMAWVSYLDLFERVIPSALALADPDTPYFAGSPHAAQEERRDPRSDRSGDYHLWEIWFSEAPFENYRNYQHRFLSEFGFQSMPDLMTLQGYAPEEAPALTIDAPWLAFRQRSQPGNARVAQITHDWFGVDGTSDFARFCRLSQVMQGEGLRIGIEYWRSQYPRTAGATYWQLNDRWAASTWATLDVRGNWKASHYIARQFFAPLLVTAIENAEAGTLDIAVVNDGPTSIEGTVEVVLTNGGGDELERWSTPVATSTQSKVVWLETLDVAQRLGTRWQPTNVLAWILFRAQATASAGASEVRRLVTFVRPRELQLHRPKLEWTVEPIDTRRASVTVTARQAPALWVATPHAIPGVRFTDLFFHLRRDASRTVEAKLPEALDLNTLRETLNLVSCLD
ncbi:MAG: glycoside hydrolase family 2 protein [Opitutales bacterium]